MILPGMGHCSTKGSVSGVNKRARDLLSKELSLK